MPNSNIQRLKYVYFQKIFILNVHFLKCIPYIQPHIYNGIGNVSSPELSFKKNFNIFFQNAMVIMVTQG